MLLSACVGGNLVIPEHFIRKDIDTENYKIATWQKINNQKNNTVHIYIEGDGHSFDAYGQPTDDPTPQGNTLRKIAFDDDFDNVVYVARPCQFIMDKNCNESDWTNGRFSKKIIDSMANAIGQIAGNKQIVLVGYSGGAMVSGLVIQQNKNLKIKQWITVAGVLNHKKWTQYFGDAELDKSLNLNQLPNVKQKHFVGEKDNIVPYELATQWADAKDIVIIKNATHNKLDGLKIFN